MWKKLISIVDVIKMRLLEKNGKKRELKEKHGNNRRSIGRCIDELLAKLDKSDAYTAKHSVEVAKITELFAKQLCLSTEEVSYIKTAALLHDIGKIDVPKEILSSRKKIDKKSRELIKKHTTNAEIIIENHYPELAKFIPAIKHHHEYWNGKGYPSKLQLDEIPLEAQIISIVDCYDALTGGRGYTKKLPVSEVCKTLLNGAGSQWNPYLIYKFVKFITNC